jgi:ADP-ribosyl-[dinitrogen reductase] hydrolase
MNNKAVDLLLGVAVGDALGVPFEFSTRADMQRNPAKEMIGFRVHNQPPGTWSDDSSLTFCLAEAIIYGYSLATTARLFVRWRNEAYWTAHNNVFDIGMTTTRAITRLEKILQNGDDADLKHLRYEPGTEGENGNGSLMRILPFLYYIKGKPITEQFDSVWENAALTHRHIRAAMSCMIYLCFAEHLVNGLDKLKAYEAMREKIMQLWSAIDFDKTERAHFARVIDSPVVNLKSTDIRSGGYVIESLEASLFSFLTTDTFKDAVLTAINFGHDTDTTGAITGGIAGIYYGQDSIPQFWIASLARMGDIITLGETLHKAQST